MTLLRDETPALQLSLWTLRGTILGTGKVDETTQRWNSGLTTFVRFQHCFCCRRYCCSCFVVFSLLLPPSSSSGLAGWQWKQIGLLRKKLVVLFPLSLLLLLLYSLWLYPTDDNKYKRTMCCVMSQQSVHKNRYVFILYTIAMQLRNSNQLYSYK